MAGKILASGELLQVVEGHHLRSRLTFRFRDGSVDDETTTFKQDTEFHLLSDHHIQKGASFPHPMDTTIDAANGTVTTTRDHGGKGQLKTERLEMPRDLSNGLILDLIKNFPRDAQEVKTSMLVTGSKPRIVKLAISAETEETFYVAGVRHKAARYLIKIEIGGITGAVAPIVGKKPLDIHVWMAKGTPATMIRTESQFYESGPLWRVELCAPSWH
jgi:hypothetical protein